MELNLAKDPKKGKRKAEEILIPLLNEGRNHDIEKAMALNALFKTILQETQDSGTRGKVWNKENFPWCRNYQVQATLKKTWRVRGTLMDCAHW